MRPIYPIKMRLCAAVALVLIVGAGAAGHASAGVETLAFGGNGQNGPCSAGYNVTQAGGAFASIYGSCPYSVNAAGTVATGTQAYSQGTVSTINQFQGSLDPSGKVPGSATSSFDRSSVSISDRSSGYNATGSGYAAANLADGTVHASAVSNLSGEGAANALEADNLHFSVAGATSSTVTNIVAQFTLDGYVVPGLAGGIGSMQWQTGIGGSGAQFSYENVGGVYQLYNLSQSGSVDIIKDTPDKIVYDATIALDGATDTVPIAQNLYLLGSLGWGLNYQNTGTIKLILPPGVTYTSDSGVFLTGGAVPEPSAWALMLAGVGGVGAMMRMRRRTASPALA